MILAFCRGKGFISAFIRWQTWSKYSHVAIVTPEGVYEATPKEGVHLRNFWDDTTGIDFFVVPTPPSRERAAKEFLESQLGQKYDYWGVLRFLVRRKSSDTKWFCSELAFRAAEIAGTKLLRGIEPIQISPGTLSLSPLLFPMDAPPNFSERRGQNSSTV